MADSFEPAAHPNLAGLAGRLRELAGDAAYQAGRDYLRKGLVKQGAVAGSTAYATVSGSTDYRVSVAFAGEAKVTCTCPAHRRSKFCKHVVAVCTALLERPADFALTEPAPEPERPKPERRPKAGRRERPSVKQQKEELRASGLETVDRLLEELAAGGVMTLGPDKEALLASAGELVRSLKLRRLGNLVLALQRSIGGQQGGGVDANVFAGLLADLYLTRSASGAHLAGQAAADPQLAEDLLGKTWREADLEPVAGLEMMELAYTRASDGEFLIETSYLAELSTGAVYAEKAIVPVQMSSAPKTRYRHRLLVDKAGLYPGMPPRRIRLGQVRQAPLAVADVERLLTHAPDALPELQRQLTERLRVPFGPTEVAALYRPAGLVFQGTLAGALDREGRFIALELPAGWDNDLPNLLPEGGAYALFGLLALEEHGMVLHCLSVVGSGLRWGNGPIYPDVH